MQKEITKDIVVFYHGFCRDGFTAAWAAWKKLGDSADYIPVIWTNQSEQIPPIKNKEIYFLDYSPLQARLDEIVKDNKSVQIIDHHISRQKEAESLPNSVFDLKHSGGFLAWKFFYPDKPVPQICLYTEDSDIWKWEIPDAQDILEFIDLKRDYDFETWDGIASDLEVAEKRALYREKGDLLKQYREKMIEDIFEEQGQLVEFEGYKVYAINAPRTLRSYFGNFLAEKRPPFGIVWSQTKDEISVSLRSNKDFDLLPLCAKYGGGGHKNASNFRLPLDAKLPWKVIDENE